MGSWELTLNAGLALFAILNPLGNVPIFFEYTQDLNPKMRRRLFDTASAVGFVTLLALTFTGKWIMQFFFQISIDEFRIAGGILLTVIAVQRILAPSHRHEVSSNDEVLEMGIVPLAIPLLVGPGAIVTSILILDRDGWIVALVALTGALAASWLILRSSVFLHRLMGKFGSLVISRIMYIFIAAIGVSFLLTGVANIFHLNMSVPNV